MSIDRVELNILDETHPMLSFDLLDSVEPLREETDAWRGLTRGVAFRDPDWVLPWWDAMGTGHRAAMVTARDESGKLVGLLPLYRPDGGRTLAAMGDGNTCSDHISVLASEDHAVEIAWQMGVFLGNIAADDTNGWDIIHIDGMVEGDEPMNAWINGLKWSNCASHASSRMSLWVKPRDESWAEHLKHHGKTQRRRMRRWTEAFDKIEGAQKHVPSNETEARVAINEVIDLHQKRWVDDGEPGSFSDPRFRSFAEETFMRFFRRGQTYLNLMKLNGKTIGGELNLIGDNQVMYSYSAGYDTDHADLEPGRVLCIDALFQMYNRDIVAVDFMRGNEAYKERFATESRRVFDLNIFAPSLLPRIKHAAYRTGFEVKQWMRRRAGRPTLDVAHW